MTVAESVVQPAVARPAALTLDVGPAGAVLRGRLDVATVGDVRERLHEAVDAGGPEVVVDLAGLETLDATGLGLLVGLHHRASRQGRRLVLRGVPPRLVRLLRATRLHRVLRVEAPADR